jgi:hypothetical protein
MGRRPSRRLPKPDRRRAFELLASCPEGCTEAILRAHGFTIEQMVETRPDWARERDSGVHRHGAREAGRKSLTKTNQMEDTVMDTEKMSARCAVFVLVTLLMAATAQARNSDWSRLLIGASSRLTCGQFNKLGRVEKDGALSWALGYVSGMATSTVEDTRTRGEDISQLPMEHKFKEPELVAAIKRRCLERPSVSSPLTVEWTYVEQ